jgi:Flp pilus assembly protein CpaB
MSRLTRPLLELRRAASWHRRLLAAGLAAMAVALSLNALSPTPPRTVAVLTAASDLAGGEPLRAADVRQVALPPAAVPHGALHSIERVIGRTLAAPVRQGQALTDVTLVGSSLLDGYGANLVASPVRIADAGAVSLLRVGDVVDVLAAAPDGTHPTAVVAPAAPVVAVPAVAADGGPVGGGALILLAVTPAVAATLAQAAVAAQLSVVLRG